MSTDYILDLEEQLKAAQIAATPVTVEVIKHTHDERVTVSSNGTVRRDLLGGKPVSYLPDHRPVVEKRLVYVPWDKEQGKILENNDTQRTVKLKSGTVRVDLKG